MEETPSAAKLPDGVLAVSTLIDLISIPDDDDDDEDDRKMPAIAKSADNDQNSVIFIPSDDDDDDDDDDSVVVLEHPPSTQHFATRAEQETSDAKLAATLQSAETKACDQRKQQDLESMKNSHAGRAVLLVEKVIHLLQKPEYVKEGIEPLGKDDAVFLAEQVFAMQAELQHQNSSGNKTPTHVSIGYHYTSQVNLDSIRTDGLLTIEDRQAAKHTNTRNIAVFGNGIYTGTNPHAFSNYGDVGLLIAVLKGTEKRVGSGGNLYQKERKDGKINTVIGNKVLGPSSLEPFYDEVILQKSNQVLPLVKYQRNKILPVVSYNNNTKFADMLWSIHEQVQQVLDEYFNESVPTTLTRVSK